MKKFISLFLFLSVFVWLLPLGAFIKPSQEKTACDGKRAFHMCGMSKNLPQKSLTDVVSFSSPGDSQAQGKSATSGGDDFLSDSVYTIFREMISRRWEEMTLSFTPLYSRPIFHPPSPALFFN